MQTHTSESVTTGHPDKVCDQISDAILDAHLTRDPTARVAVETLATSHGITVAGEIRSTNPLNHAEIESTVRETITRIGYTSESGYDPNTITITQQITTQSPEIAAAVDTTQLGAGDQGIMFGYATTETPELMPMPLLIARRLTEHLEQARTSRLPWLYPDGKAQATITYDGDTPTGIDTIVVSAQHAPGIPIQDVREAIRLHVIAPVLEQFPTLRDPRLIINPAGSWTHGGPAADTGLTGRKIIVDTYGGMAPHGGGAFSGKDPSKVDRSAAYAARQAARHLITEGYARQAIIRLAYAIGVPEPVAIDVEATSSFTDTYLARIIRNQFDFTPQAIIDRLNLTNPIYEQTARHGHFGHPEFPWEH